MRHKRTLVIAVVAAVALIAAAIAEADTLGISKGIASGGGTPKKPVAASLSYAITFAGTGNARPLNESKFTFFYSGIKVNGTGFPVCTPAEVQAHESTSVCPKGSLIGTGSVVAEAGPTSTPTSNFPCDKGLDLYNGGGTKVTGFLFGPGSKCAGVAYIAPVSLYWTNSSKGATLTLPIPYTVTHPLPGISGGALQNATVFPKKTLKVHGKTRNYIESIGCGKVKNRTFTVDAFDASGEATKSVAAGKC